MAEMEVEIIQAEKIAHREMAAERAAEVLAEGGLVVHPTETVYGLGGDGSPGNNDLIARVKQREPGQPLLLLVADLETLHSAFSDLEWSDTAQVLAERFWPGPLTLVFRRTGADSSADGAGGGVAIRVSPDPTIAAVLAAWRKPLTSTSVNLSGRPAARRLPEALSLFQNRPDLAEVDVPVLAIDAGVTVGTLPSTIVSLVESPPRLLREGPVSREQLERTLSDLR